MLNTFTPFPQPGSAGLVTLDGSRVLARINQVFPDGTATVFIGNAFGSSGAKRIPLAAIEDGTALTEAEAADLGALERAMAEKGRMPPKKLQRYNALKARDDNAPILQGLLARHRRQLARQQQQVETAPEYA